VRHNSRSATTRSTLVLAAILVMAAVIVAPPAPGRSQPAPEAAAQSPSVAELVFVRKSRFMAGLETAVVRVDDEVVARVDNGKTVTAPVSAGDHVIDIRTPGDFGRLTLPFKAEGGQTYRVELDAQAPQSIVGLGGVPLFIRPPYSSSACGGRWCAVISRVEPAAVPAAGHFSPPNPG
jgi:hypothetical protein